MDSGYEVPTKIQGFLEKKFRLRVCSWWRKYWFVLEGKTLFCFKNKEESDIYFQKPNSRKAFISFTNVHGVRRVPTASTNRFVFEIVTKGPVFYLAADEEAACTKWIEALQNALQLPNISPPLKNFRKQSGTSVCIPTTKDYSSQPNLHHSVQRKWSVENNKCHSFCLYTPEIHIEEDGNESKSEFVNSCNTGHIIADGVESDCGVLLRNKARTTGQYLAVMRDTHVWRNTASEFFLSENNRNWPGLSLDLYDEVLDEIMLQYKEERSKLRRSERSAISGDLPTDKNTQTDFPDDQLLDSEQFQEARNELISYLSSTSLNQIILGNELTLTQERPSSARLSAS